MARKSHRERKRAREAEPCGECRRPLVQPARGRRHRYCSHACRQRAYRRRRDGARRRRLVTLVEADARAFLPTVPAECVDLVVSDFPYQFERGTTYFRNWFVELPDEEWPTILGELYRVLVANSHCYLFCDGRTRPLFDAAAKATGFRVHDPPLIWDKDWLGLGGGAWRSQYEFIAFYEKGRRRGNSRSLGNVLRARRPHRGYPTEKPVAVLKTLIGQASAPGELVLDPFCGSGNVGRAARELGRRALLCDIDAAFAARRLRLAAAPFGHGSS